MLMFKSSWLDHFIWNSDKWLDCLEDQFLIPREERYWISTTKKTKNITKVIMKRRKIIKVQLKKQKIDNMCWPLGFHYCFVDYGVQEWRKTPNRKAFILVAETDIPQKVWPVDKLWDVTKKVVQPNHGFLGLGGYFYEDIHKIVFVTSSVSWF